ncbi:amidohydrolase family protein [Lactiplantibacillus fabifermentans]|uniref:amidohydrolase family protein n=1 Tax=Lactiplantibacillus fabifermentans TaxID=483011 RepID=UPI0004B3557E|nr:amidohydrolase family protein [Lactiplantibacillus fabifermentans]
MLAIEPKIPEMAPYVKARALSDMAYRQAQTTVPSQQIISMMNLNPEDYVAAPQALKLCQQANDELVDLVQTHPDQFVGAVAMLPLNNRAGVEAIMTEQVAKSAQLFGVQLFTRALGKSIADADFDYIFALANRLNFPIWLHPVFDDRKPDNNIVFSWEYELTLAMQQLVTNGIFQKYPNLKIIVHHAGAMASFFAGRINAIIPADQAADFRKFYVDTAILGNPTALKLTTEFFGVEHVLFGTDAPLGIAPVGATKQIIDAIMTMTDQPDMQQQILSSNPRTLLSL